MLYVEVCGQLQHHTSAALSQEKERWYPLDRRLGGPQAWSGRGGEEEKPQLLLGIEPPSSIPYPSHFIDLRYLGS